MKLTVGPLPPAVYWRRRAVVGCTLLLLVFMLLYSCSKASNAARNTPAAKRSTEAPTPSSSSRSIFTPSAGISPQAVGEPPIDPASEPAPTASAAEPPAQTGPCTDGEMTITAIPAQAAAASGAFVRFSLRIKNTSNRSCTRDVGVDAQELYLQDAAKAKWWSSDTCDTRHGTDVRTFAPAIEAEFYVDWDGKASNAGCADRKAVPPGKYQLVGRLVTKFSEPAPVELK